MRGTEGRHDSQRLALFYRGGSGSLAIWADIDDTELSCKKAVKVSSVQELCEVESFGVAACN